MKPSPFLYDQRAASTVGLQINGSDYLISNQYRQGEVAKHPLSLRNVCLEPVIVAEEQLEALSLDDQRVER
jgi:hypothetical protein